MVLVWFFTEGVVEFFFPAWGVIPLPSPERGGRSPTCAAKAAARKGRDSHRAALATMEMPPVTAKKGNFPLSRRRCAGVCLPSAARTRNIYILLKIVNAHEQEHWLGPASEINGYLLFCKIHTLTIFIP